MPIMQRFFDWAGYGGPIKRGERATWAQPTTLDGVAELTAQWLEGDLKSQPGYYGPCDVDEAAGLLVWIDNWSGEYRLTGAVGNHVRITGPALVGYVPASHVHVFGGAQ